MINGWREDFAHPSKDLGTGMIPWVGVQLPGYGYGVFDMRLAQAAGVESVAAAAIVPTYDLSCPACPYGAIHPTDKSDVGQRVALELQRLLLNDTTVIAPSDSPMATRAVANANEMNSSVLTVTVYLTGPAQPFKLTSTRNCTLCCSATNVSDFDVTFDDGVKWVMGTSARIVESGGDAAVEFDVVLPAAALAKPTMVRYTASQVFPQCAVTNVAGLPATPFQLEIESRTADSSSYHLY